MNCVAAAFSVALDVPYEELVASINEEFNYDSEKLLPNVLGKTGYDPRQFVYWAAKRDIYIVQFDFKLDRAIANYIHTIDVTKEALSMMNNKKGVLTGMTMDNMFHSVYWNGEHVIDPINRSMYDIDMFRPDCFYYILKKIDL